MKVQAQLCLFYGAGTVVVDSFSLIFLPLDCWGSAFAPCLVRHYLVSLSSFAIILTRSR